jgi:hypothetical protein
LPNRSAIEIDFALSELLTAQALVRDGAVYMLAHRVWVAALVAELDPEQTKLRHHALAMMYGDKERIAFIHHAFLCDLDEQALLVMRLRYAEDHSATDYVKLVDQNFGKMVWCYPRAIASTRALGGSARSVHDLRNAQFLGCVFTRDAPDRESTRLWFDQLAHDSGLELYRRDAESANPAERLTRALQAAHQRYLATPEHERVYPVDEAIRKLGEYVVVSIALGARTLDNALLRSLPDVLEPFVPLSPLLDVIWNNALATRASRFGHYEYARDKWRETLVKLDTQITSKEVFIIAMRNAIAYAIGMMEAQLGIATAADWADRLDEDPYQRVSALDLRRIVRLEQGDAMGADRLRRRAEVLALQQRAPQMFQTLLSVELAAYANNGDLTGVGQVIEQLKPLAARFATWQPDLLAAEGSFQLVRGDHEAARPKFERTIELTRFEGDDDSPQMGAWIAAQAGLAECWIGLGRFEDARYTASSALQICESRQIVAAAFDLVRTLGLAEAKLGDARAAQRLDALIAMQNQLGATGLRMGLSYEARARVAIWSGDAAAFEQFAELTAREYRHGARTALAARYERLINEAARGGMRARVALADFEALAGVDTSALGSEELFTVITRSMAGSRSLDERAQRALQMICAAHGSGVGHLYLITPAGLVLRASHGAATPALALAERVARYVTDKQRHSEDIDDMVTGDLAQEQALTSLIDSAGVSYELLALSCVVDAISTLAGVAAIEVTETRVRNEKQTQLLNALAASLLHAGDGHWTQAYKAP